MKQHLGGDWFTYDWQIDGKRALFAVDLSYKYAGKSDDYPFLFFVNCSSRKKTRDTLSNLERLCARLILRRLQLLLNPIYVGSIEMNRQIQYFMYCKTVQEAAAVKAYAKKQKMLRCRIDYADEPTWETYFALLYPNAAKKQTRKNVETIELMRKRGDVLKAPRRVRLHMFFPNEPSMLAFSEKARLQGFAVGEPEFVIEQPLPYGVIIIRVVSLNKRDLDNVTTRAIQIAERFGGALSYWECPLMSKKQA